MKIRLSRDRILVKGPVRGEKTGDQVLIRKYSGSEVTLNGERHRIQLEAILKKERGHDHGC